MESKTIHWEIQIQPTEEFMTNKKKLLKKWLTTMSKNRISQHFTNFYKIYFKEL